MTKEEEAVISRSMDKDLPVKTVRVVLRGADPVDMDGTNVIDIDDTVIVMLNGEKVAKFTQPAGWYYV